MRLCKFRLCLFFFFSSFPHSHTVSDRRSDNDLMTAYQNNQPPFTNKTHHKLGYIHRPETKHRAKLLVEYRLIHSTQQWFMLRLQHKKSPFSHTTHGNSSRSHHNMAFVVVGWIVAPQKHSDVMKESRDRGSQPDRLQKGIPQSKNSAPMRKDLFNHVNKDA